VALVGVEPPVPHLYFRCNAEGKVHSVFVAAEQSEAIKDAQSARRRFQEVDAEISTENRAQLLRSLERDSSPGSNARARARAGRANLSACPRSRGHAHPVLRYP